MGKSVLIVDDSAAVRKSIAYVLGEQGYTVSEASDGSAALDWARVNAADMIITDVNMPNMTGIELVRNIRRLPSYRYVPILVLTTESQAEKLEEGKQAGATGWIVKPFSQEKLVQIVGKLLGAG